MDRDELLKLFREAFKPNFMTPKVLKFSVHGNRVIELSEGTSMFVSDPIWGVTVRDYVNGRFIDPGLSKMFHHKAFAEDYMRSL